MTNYLPKISSYNSDQFKNSFRQNTPSQSQTPNRTLPTPSTQENGGELKPRHLPKIQSTPQHLSPVVIENRFAELEAKISVLQESNSMLLNKLNQTERRSSLQIQDLLMKTNDEKTNRYKSEKMMNMLSDQNNLTTKDLTQKINILQETIEKGETFQTQQRERDMEIYKNIIAKLTDKVSDIVKKEIEERFKADLNNRENNLQIKNYFENELGFIKRDLEKFIGQNQAELQKMSLECSERTHNVSKYIDQQIQENVYGKGSSNELLKNFVSKLTDQVKFNLVSQNNKNAYFEQKIIKLDEKIFNGLTNLETKLNAVEDRMTKKVDTLKTYTEMNLTKINKDFYAELREYSNNIDKQMSFLAGQLIDTRKRTSENFDIVLKDSREKFRAIIEDMKTMSNRIYQYESLLKTYDEQFNTLNKKVTDDINNCVSKMDVAIVNERMLCEVQMVYFQNEIDKTNETILRKEKEIYQTIDTKEKEIYNTMEQKEKTIYDTMNQKEKEIRDTIDQKEKEIRDTIEQKEKDIRETMDEKERQLKEVIDKNYQEAKENFAIIYPRLDEHDERLDELEEKNDKRFEFLNEEVKNIEVKNIINEMVNRAESSKLGEKLEQVDTNFVKVYQSIADIEYRADNMEKDITSLIDKTNQIEKNFQDVNDTVNSFRQEIDNQKSIVFGMQTQVQDLDREQKKISGRINELDTEFQTYTEETTAQNLIDIGILRAEAQALNRMVNENKIDSEQKIKTVEDNLKKFKSMEDKFKDIDKMNKALEDNISSLCSKIEINSMMDKVVVNTEIKNIYEKLNKISTTSSQVNDKEIKELINHNKTTADEEIKGIKDKIKILETNEKEFTREINSTEINSLIEKSLNNAEFIKIYNNLKEINKIDFNKIISDVKKASDAATAAAASATAAAATAASKPPTTSTKSKGKPPTDKKSSASKGADSISEKQVDKKIATAVDSIKKQNDNILKKIDKLEQLLSKQAQENPPEGDDPQNNGEGSGENGDEGDGNGEGDGDGEGEGDGEGDGEGQNDDVEKAENDEVDPEDENEV